MPLSYASTSAGKLTFHWEDPLNTMDLLAEDEIAILETARTYCQEKLLPRVLRKNTFFHSSVPSIYTLNKLQLFGLPEIPNYVPIFVQSFWILG